MVEYVQYDLVEWRDDDKTPEVERFKSDFTSKFKLTRLNDRIIMTLLERLGEFKEKDPDGQYSLVPFPQKNGARFLVKRKGFYKIRAAFPSIVSGLLNEYESRVR